MGKSIFIDLVRTIAPWGLAIKRISDPRYEGFLDRLTTFSCLEQVLPCTRPFLASMGPSGWANEDQRKFLKEWSPAYESCRVEKKYTDFWRKLFNAYLVAFPLVEEMFPGSTVANLDEEQSKEYGERLSKLQAVSPFADLFWTFPQSHRVPNRHLSRQRLKEWYRWQYNPRSRNITAAITKKDLKDIYRPRTRGFKAYEIYAKLFPQKVADAQKELCTREGTTGHQILGKWHAVCKELLANASEEELQTVEEALAARAQELEEDDVKGEEFTPERYQR